MQVTSRAYSVRSLAIAAISTYQRHISPHKGFSCAHRRLYGGLSCSEYVKRTLTNHNLLDSISLARQRFQACNNAHRIIQRRCLRCSHSNQVALPSLAMSANSAPTLLMHGTNNGSIERSEDGAIEPARSDNSPEPQDEKGPERGFENEDDEPVEKPNEGEYTVPPGSQSSLESPDNDCKGCCFYSIGDQLCCCDDVCSLGICGGMGGCGDPLTCCAGCWGGTRCGDFGDPFGDCGCVEGIDCGTCSGCL